MVRQWCLTWHPIFYWVLGPLYVISPHLFSLVAQSYLTLCNPMGCSTPGCPSPTPGAYSNSCPSRQWCHPTISSSVVPFSSCHQSFPLISLGFFLAWWLQCNWQLTSLKASGEMLPEIKWEFKLPPQHPQRRGSRPSPGGAFRPGAPADPTAGFLRSECGLKAASPRGSAAGFSGG